MRGLLNPGDEVLIPSPDYPLWTAAVTMHGGRPLYYPCKPENGFVPTIMDIRALVTSRTRAIVVINPNNPAGVIYPKELLQDIVAMAEEYPFGGMVIFADEIYDQITFDGNKMTHMASLCHNTLCCSFGGLSKVYRACGFRVGWLVMSGNRSRAVSYENALNLLSGLRLCANVPGQYAVIPALQDKSIKDLVAPGGRLYEARKVILNSVAKSKYMSIHEPQGALYAFVEVNLPDFDDQVFALDLVEKKHILIAPGSSFNVPYKNHFRITLLPPPDKLREAFQAIDEVLEEYAQTLEQRKEEALKIVQAMRAGEDKERIEKLRSKAKF
jgi:alanine-synthesizing transaminase